MINMDLAYKIAEQIDLFPEMYDQSTWASPHCYMEEAPVECGTAYCYAGWTCLVAGYTWNGHTWNKDGQVVTTWGGTEGLAIELLCDDPQDYYKMYPIFSGRFVHHDHLTPGTAFTKYLEGADLLEVGHPCTQADGFHCAYCDSELFCER